MSIRSYVDMSHEKVKIPNLLAVFLKEMLKRVLVRVRRLGKIDWAGSDLQST